MPASIVDCPNELIAEFLLHLQSKQPSLSAFRLVLTCRQIYHALLPSLLKFHIDRLREAEADGHFSSSCLENPPARGVSLSPSSSREHPPPTFNSLTEQEYALLCGATFKEIRCTINLLSAAQIWSLHGLVSRAKGLQHMSIQFEQHRDTVYLKEGDPDPDAVYKAFFKLLQVCSEHEGVSIEITITTNWLGRTIDWQNSPFRHQVVTLPTAPSTTPSHPPLSNTTSGVTSPKAKTASTGLVESAQPSLPHIRSRAAPLQLPFPPPNFSNSRVSRLNFRGCTGFSSTWYPHFRQLVAHSSSTLTHLSLSHIGLRHYDWHFIVPEWNFPHLTHFESGNSTIPAPDLVSFLHRHPMLEFVDISQHTAVGKAQLLEEGKNEFLPKLKVLMATPEYLIPFLDHNNSILPNLDVLQIARGLEISGVVPLDDFTSVLRRVARRSRTLPIRKLWLCVDRPCASFGNWLRTLVASEDGELATAIAALRGTTSLEISTATPERKNRPLNPSTTQPFLPLDLVVDFVAVFPELEEVIVDDECRILHPLPSKEDLDIAVAQLWGRCSRLANVKIRGGVPHDANGTWERPLSL